MIVSEWFGNVGDPSKGRQMPVHYSFRQANFVSEPLRRQLQRQKHVIRHFEGELSHDSLANTALRAMQQ